MRSGEITLTVRATLALARWLADAAQGRPGDALTAAEAIAAVVALLRSKTFPRYPVIAFAWSTPLSRIPASNAGLLGRERSK